MNVNLPSIKNRNSVTRTEAKGSFVICVTGLLLSIIGREDNPSDDCDLIGVVQLLYGVVPGCTMLVYWFTS